MTNKVVFVTIDDGIEKDPKFIQMVKDFQIPLTISLADVLIRDDYAYFEKLCETGYISIQNHTVHHRWTCRACRPRASSMRSPASRTSS